MQRVRGACKVKGGVLSGAAVEREAEAAGGERKKGVDEE